MLLVPVRIDRTPLNGLGVFAVRRIPKGSWVWRFTPGFDIEMEPVRVHDQPEHFRRVLLDYGYLDPRRKRFILCCDDARFINHSDTPNLWLDLEDHRPPFEIAVRDIEAGEEITIDYRLLEGTVPESVICPA